MRKSKILALCLVVCIALMGAGYAYWTESLSFSNTISTGELNLEFVRPGILEAGDYDNTFKWPDKLKTFLKNPNYYDGSKYMDVDIEIGDSKNHSLVCTFSDIYPGAGGFISFLIKNTGTVPATISSIDRDQIGAENLAVLNKFQYNINSISLFRINLGPLGKPTTLVSSSINKLTFDQFIGRINQVLQGQVIEPGDILAVNVDNGNFIEELQTQVGYSIVLPTSITNDDDMEGKTVEFKLNMNFEQATR